MCVFVCVFLLGSKASVPKLTPVGFEDLRSAVLKVYLVHSWCPSINFKKGVTFYPLVWWKWHAKERLKIPAFKTRMEGLFSWGSLLFAHKINVLPQFIMGASSCRQPLQAGRGAKDVEEGRGEGSFQEKGRGRNSLL